MTGWVEELVWEEKGAKHLGGEGETRWREEGWYSAQPLEGPTGTESDPSWLPQSCLPPKNDSPTPQDFWATSRTSKCASVPKRGTQRNRSIKILGGLSSCLLLFPFSNRCVIFPKPQCCSWKGRHSNSFPCGSGENALCGSQSCMSERHTEMAWSKVGSSAFPPLLGVWKAWSESKGNPVPTVFTLRGGEGEGGLSCPRRGSSVTACSSDCPGKRLGYSLQGQRPNCLLGTVLGQRKPDLNLDSCNHTDPSWRVGG